MKVACFINLVKKVVIKNLKLNASYGYFPFLDKII